MATTTTNEVGAILDDLITNTVTRLEAQQETIAQLESWGLGGLTDLQRAELRYILADEGATALTRLSEEYTRRAIASIEALRPGPPHRG